MDYANMNYIIYFDYASLIVMSVLIISFYMIKHINNMQNRMLKVMLLSHFLVIGMDIINVMGLKLTLPFIYQILYGSHLCYFLLHSVTAFAFLLLLFYGGSVWRREAVASGYYLSSDGGYFCIGGIEFLDGLDLSSG